MIRSACVPIAAMLLLACVSGATAQTARRGKAPSADKAAAAPASVGRGKGGPPAQGADRKGGGAAKPALAGSYGDWSAYLAQGGKDKTCYALAQPKDRSPSGMNRDPAFLFISTRPAEGVRNEVSLMMGFSVKDGADAKADVSGATFALVAKGANVWIKNAAEETQFIEAMKRGSKLTFRAPSTKGNMTTDSYSLAGFSQALERITKDCQ